MNDLYLGMYYLLIDTKIAVRFKTSKVTEKYDATI